MRRLFRKVNRYVGNHAPMLGVFPDYPAPVIRNTDNGDRGTKSKPSPGPHQAHVRDMRLLQSPEPAQAG